MTNKNLDEMYEDACVQLTKAHNMIDALEKQIVMLRSVVVIAAQRGDLFEHDQAQAEAALVATQDLSGLVLCDAEPVGFFEVNDFGNWEQDTRNIGTPLYKARKQP